MARLGYASLILALACGWSAPGSADTPPWALFGTQETRSDNMSLFKKWTDAVERSTSEKTAREGSCQEGRMNTCHYKEWQAFVETLRGTRRITQLREINGWLNRARYITDPVNYGMDDYWASPGEFLEKNGDCEDYAIAKYMSLKQLGWPVVGMRVVAVQDLNLKAGHAILVVDLDGVLYLLDNQVREVVEANTVKHYNPMFSINESAWWRHKR
ncbi:transglutaminase-like cysteine peptidase [Paramagnetospirillum kuznetsovii]|nr:transglutaminase-like cysteine peptidase [Paramagnetospirillum kuznetsovii]